MTKIGLIIFSKLILQTGKKYKFKANSG